MLLGIAQAIDWISIPISSLRKMALALVYIFFDWLPATFETGIFLPVVTRIVFLLLEFVILVTFPLIAAWLYSWVITYVIRLLRRNCMQNITSQPNSPPNDSPSGC